MLGQRLLHFLKKENTYNIYGVSRGENRLKDQEGYTYISTDLTREDQVTDLIETVQPDVIIHTAAMTNVDQCELEHEECDRINVEAVRYLAEMCKKYDIHLVHLSTDFVFNGEKGYYKEEDDPDPVNYYGLSKLRSEQIIQESGIHHTIIRTILVFGITETLKSNIVLWVVNNLKENKPINVVTDQLRMPTFADDLAKACIFAAENRVEGLFHVSTNRLISIYEIARMVAKSFDLNENLISPVPTSRLTQPARRPLKTGFDISKAISRLKLPGVSFENRLQVFKDQLANLKEC